MSSRNMARLAISIGAFTLLGLGLWLFISKRTPNILRCSDCNVVLIVLDPLRADALSFYGNKRVTTPTIDALAGKGIVFTNAFAASSWTLPSAMSLMTGVYPSQHTITNKELIPKEPSGNLIPASLTRTAPGLKTLASELKSAGYVTGGFAGGAALGASYGFDQGFDVYRSEGTFEGLPTVAPAAIDFLRSHRNEKMFVFIHGFDTHGQYVPQGGYDRRYVDPLYKGTLTGSAEEQKALREEGVSSGRIYLNSQDVTYLRSIYDEKVARADESIRKIVDEIEALKLSSKTIIFITSDHGDEFYEHGRIDHGMTLFDEVLHVPLIMVIPEGVHKKITSQVRLIDIIPTLFGLISHRPSERAASQLQGANLLPLVYGKDMKLDVFAETVYRYATFLKGLRDVEGTKLIYDEESQTKQLFNLTSDPGEQEDIYGQDERKSSLLTTKLLHFIESLSVNTINK